jgi:para-nitrobenzyl esterase
MKGFVSVPNYSLEQMLNRKMNQLRFIWIPALAAGTIGLLAERTYKSSRVASTGIPDTVQIQSGLVEGRYSPLTGVTVFKGIPYAAPPLGPLRWKAPRPALPWAGVKACYAFGPSPIQLKPVPFLMLTREFLVPEEPMNEDCLYLNVWTGARHSGDRRPVLVWIYGGGFNTGGAAAPAYDGEQMASKGCVFVSFNYRLGIFGFFSHPELTKESDQHVSGNYGLLDQVEALKWIRANIAAFGGDPFNVTIAGQSAGSMSVNCLMASPLAKGLVQKAIAESGTLVTEAGFFTLPDLGTAEKRGQALASAIKSPSLEGLRKIPAEKLFYRTLGFFGPVLDGYVLPRSITEKSFDRNPDHLPFMTGWCQDEGIVFKARSKDDYVRRLRDDYGNNTSFLLKYYPASTDSVAALSQLALSRDKMIAMPDYRLVNRLSESGDTVYVYNFTRKPPPASPENAKYGAFHTAEIPYVLNDLRAVARPWENVDYALAKIASDYWFNFASYGSPNGSGLPFWPLYNQKEKKVMILGDSVHAASLPNHEALDFFQSFQEKKSR